MWNQGSRATLSAMTGEQKWYYEELGELVGPVNGETLCDMLRLGVLTSVTPVWRDGLVGRQPANIVPELLEHVSEQARLNPQLHAAAPQVAGLPPLPVKVPNSGKAVASLVLGIVSLSLFCVWPISLPCGIIGMVLGLVANRGPHKQSFATAGVIMSLIGLLLPALFFLHVILTQ